ncbi:MAG: hypothetical protein PHW74_10475 [Desulfobacca sp.]|nr:hypothetical protein [Desulfobacca sp.]
MPLASSPATWIIWVGQNLYETLNPFWLHLDQQLVEPRRLHLWVSPEQENLGRQLQEALPVLSGHYKHQVIVKVHEPRSTKIRLGGLDKGVFCHRCSQIFTFIPWMVDSLINVIAISTMRVTSSSWPIVKAGQQKALMI